MVEKCSELETARQRVESYRNCGHPVIPSAIWLLVKVERQRVQIVELEASLAERDAKIDWLWQERVATAKLLPPDSGFDLERADDRLQDAVASVLAERDATIVAQAIDLKKCQAEVRMLVAQDAEQEREHEALRNAAQAVVNYWRQSDYEPYPGTLSAFLGRLAAVLTKKAGEKPAATLKESGREHEAWRHIVRVAEEYRRATLGCGDEPEARRDLFQVLEMYREVVDAVLAAKREEPH